LRESIKKILFCKTGIIWAILQMLKSILKYLIKDDFTTKQNLKPNSIKT